ncbi:MAG TPA: type II toxin-antitoxin system RelE/ParE family toxin [Candidatus Bilamarchaeaceae archaeon]|nr:type II toxin-antitoxin system RelE/ParE family toxin [Candidatus Bilamarchaeaceae archaeon]
MYDVRLTRKAQKGYETLFPIDYQKKVDGLLIVLETNIRPGRLYDITQLAENTYRVRLGKVRVQYTIFEEEKVILIYKIGFKDDSTYKP